VNDPDVVRAGTSDGWNIRLLCQPPNSPDLNVLDLGYFNALQSMQIKNNSKNVEEIIATVKEAYHEMNMATLDNIFITLQKFMECILLTEGSNRYKKPHICKSKLRKAGVALDALECSQQAQAAAKATLDAYERKGNKQSTNPTS